MKYDSLANLSWRSKTMIFFISGITIFTVGFYIFLKAPLAEKQHRQLLCQNDKQQYQILNQLRTSNNLRALKLLKNNLSTNELLTLVTTVAENVGLTLLKLHPLPQHQSVHLHIEHLAITATGSFPQMISFFQALLRLPYFISLTRWQLTPINVSSKKINLLIEVYHY